MSGVGNENEHVLSCAASPIVHFLLLHLIIALIMLARGGISSVASAVTGFGRLSIAESNNASSSARRLSYYSVGVVGAESTVLTRNLKAMIVATRAQGGVRLRFISTTSPLYAGRLTAKGGNEDSSNAATSITSSDNNISDEKKAMIDRWMKWNTTNNWKYTPNPDLIAKIGKGEGSPLDQFRDLVPRAKRESEEVGRSWSAKELRRKSYDDLHKLWYELLLFDVIVLFVIFICSKTKCTSCASQRDFSFRYVLYKEKNMLLTESNLARRHMYEMIQPDRRRKVQKSMGAIKQVLGERKRKKIADYRAYLGELERYKGLMMAASSSSLTSSSARETIEGGNDSGIAASMEDAMDTEAENLIPKSERAALEGKE